jgi:hypothetical protein
LGVEFAERLFESVEAALEVAHFKSAICEAEGLTDVHVLFDGVYRSAVSISS